MPKNIFHQHYNYLIEEFAIYFNCILREGAAHCWFPALGSCTLGIKMDLYRGENSLDISIFKCTDASSCWRQAKITMPDSSFDVSSSNLIIFNKIFVFETVYFSNKTLLICLNIVGLILQINPSFTCHFDMSNQMIWICDNFLSSIFYVPDFSMDM